MSKKEIAVVFIIKSTGTHGSLCKTYVKIFKHNQIQIETLFLEKEEANKEDSFILLKQYKDKYLYERLISCKFETMEVIINALIGNVHQKITNLRDKL